MERGQMSPGISTTLEGLQRALEAMGSSHRPEETFIASLACSIADHREEAVHSLAANKVTLAVNAEFEAQIRCTMMESLQSEIDRLRAQFSGALAFDPSSVASFSQEDHQLAQLQAEVAHLREMLRLR